MSIFFAMFVMKAGKFLSALNELFAQVLVVVLKFRQLCKNFLAGPFYDFRLLSGRCLS